MDNYALGKDIQAILERLDRIEQKLAASSSRRVGSLSGVRLPLTEHAPKLLDSELPIRGAKSGDTLAVRWDSPFNAVFGTFSSATLTVVKSDGDVPLTAEYFGLENQSISPLLFALEFRVLDGAGNVLDMGQGDGTDFSWVPAPSVPARSSDQHEGPYSHSKWTPGFLRTWDRIAFIEARRTVEIDPNG